MIFLNPFRGPAADHLDPAADWPPLCLGRLEHFRNGLIYVEVFFWKCLVGFQSVFNFTLVVSLFYNLNRWLLSLCWLRSHGCLNLPRLPIKTRRQRSSLLARRKSLNSSFVRLGSNSIHRLRCLHGAAFRCKSIMSTSGFFYKLWHNETNFLQTTPFFFLSALRILNLFQPAPLVFTPVTHPPSGFLALLFYFIILFLKSGCILKEVSPSCLTQSCRMTRTFN